MRLNRLIFLAGCVVVALSFAAPAHAQFRNQAFRTEVGWLGLGTTWDRAFHGGNPAGQDPLEAGWNLQDQPTLGLGHSIAIGYQTWIDTEAALGAWTTVIDNPLTPVISLQVGGGIRYNFLEERHRPYVAMHLQTLTLIAFPAANKQAPIPTNAFFGNTPFFAGARPTVGYEWVFGDEMSFNVEAGFIAFLAPAGERAYGSIFLPGHTLKAGWLIYF